MRRQTVALSIAALLVLAAIVVGVRQFAIAPDGFPSYRPVAGSELAGRSEVRLQYPGSIQLHVDVHDMKQPVFLYSGSPAWISTTLGVNVSAGEVTAWYRAALQSRGWLDVPDTNGSAQIYWKHGSRELFSLYFNDPSEFGYINTDRSTEYVASYIVGFSS